MTTALRSLSESSSIGTAFISGCLEMFVCLFVCLGWLGLLGFVFVLFHFAFGSCITLVSLVSIGFGLSYLALFTRRTLRFSVSGQF